MSIKFLISAKNQIPNFLTLINLFLGILSIVSSFNGLPEQAAWLILLAAIFDFLDGFAARLLNAYSDLGKELDSLADLISFGLAPAVILYQLMLTGFYPYGSAIMADLSINSLSYYYFKIVVYFPFLLTLFSAYRLAKFNIDTRQKDSFIGLPTPASALLIVSFPMIIATSDTSLWVNELLINPTFLLPFTLLLSYLLVAPISLLSLKFKNLSWKDNKWRYLLLVFSLLAILLFRWSGVPIILLGYVILSVLNVIFAQR